jgi:hypothetical protein
MLLVNLIEQLRRCWRRVLWRLFDATLIPMALFLIGSRLNGVITGLLFGSSWVCSRAVIGVLRGKPVPAIVLAACFSSVRVGVAVLFMSPQLWVVQGVAHTASVGALLCATSLRGTSPLLGNAINDVFPFLGRMLGAAQASFSRSVGVVWGAQQVLLAMLNLVLLRVMPVQTFIIVRPFIGWALAVPTFLVTLMILKRAVERNEKLLVLAGTSNA